MEAVSLAARMERALTDPFAPLAGLDRPLRIAFLGECMIELSDLDAPDGRVAMGVAGDTLNSAIYFRRMTAGLPVEVDYLTALGTDGLSGRMIGFMQGEGIGTDAIVRFADRLPGVYAIELDAAGERSFHYWRNQSAARSMLGPGGITDGVLHGYDGLYLSGITLAILPKPVRHLLVRACATMKAAGKLVAFDSNYRPRLWESPDDARATIDALWAVAGVGLPSRDDEEALWGEADAGAILRRLARRGLGEIALKDGAGGPHLWAGEPLPRGGYPPVATVVDTTSAGDAFNAGYLAARLAGQPAEQAAQTGHALAGVVIGHKGAIIPRAAMPAPPVRA